MNGIFSFLVVVSWQNISGRVKKFFSIFALSNLVVIAQLVRASDCGSEGRGFEPH